MRIVLINPPQVFSDTMTSAGVIPPLGLLYIASTLKNAGYDVKLIDSVIEGVNAVNLFSESVATRGLDIEKIAARVKEMKPDIVGISDLFSFAFPVVLEVSKRIKTDLAGVKIVVGGAHPSATPHETLESGHIDFVIISEGERTILNLLADLSLGKADFPEIDGLAYRKKNGEIVINPKRKFIENLDALPFPGREMIPLAEYFKAKESHGMTKGRWTPILSSRGCPYECAFCTPELWGRRYRVRSAENVLAEISECNKKYGIKEFHFEDENLTIDKGRLLKICEGIKKIDSEIEWQAPSGIRASVTDGDILKAMKDSGCEHITVAPESGSRRVLKEIIRKNQDLDKVTEIVRQAKKIGLKTLAYFILGLPGETKEDIKMTIDYVKELARVGLDEVGFSNYIPLPGSELYAKLKRENRLKIDNWFDLLSIADISRSFSWCENATAEELKKFRKNGYLAFHLTKLLYHPLAVLTSVFNIITGRQRLKTERVVNTMIKRKIQKIFRR